MLTPCDVRRRADTAETKPADSLDMWISLRSRSNSSRLRLLLLCVVSCSALLAACGGDSTPAPQQTPLTNSSAGQPGANQNRPADAATAAAVAVGGGGGANRGDICSLVTKADAEAASGVKMADPEKTPSGCNYVADGQAQPVVFVQMGGKKKDYEFAKTVYKDQAAVSGIGDAAFMIQLGAPVSSLHVVKGDSYYIVSITNIQQPDAARQQSVKDLATKIVAKS